MDCDDSTQRILAIDIGGTNVKVRTTEEDEIRKHPSGPDLTPKELISRVRSMTEDWDYDVISIGYPGPVLDGRAACEPRTAARNEQLPKLKELGARLFLDSEN